MASILQLDDFYVQRFEMEFHPGEVTDGGDVIDPGRLAFDYNVLYSSERPDQWALVMTVYLAPPEDDAVAGYEFEAQLFGFFNAEGIDPDAVEYVVRVNGMMVLYGILRGQVAGFSGVFPMGKVMLPSVDMLAVVEAIEADKAAELEEEVRKASKQKAKSKAKPKKKAAAKKKAPAKKKAAAKKKSPAPRKRK